MANADGMITLDDRGWPTPTGLGWAAQNGPPVIASDLQTITVTGSRCRSYRSTAGYADVAYDGNEYWMTEMPGYIMFSDENGICNFTFAQPISAFVMRISAYVKVQKTPNRKLYTSIRY